MLQDPVVLAVAIVGVALGAFAGGVVGMGFPIVAVPTLALGYNLETAVVVTAIPTLAIDIVNLHRTRDQRHDASGLFAFGVFAGIASLVGTLARDTLSEQVMVILLTVVIALYLVTEFLPHIDLHAFARHPTSGAISGSAAGVLQATVGISGPIVGMYFLNRAESRHSFIFHVTVVFATMGTIRIATLLGIGEFTGPRVLAAAVITALALVVRTIGFSIGDRVDRDRFRKMVLIVLAASLVPLLAQAF